MKELSLFKFCNKEHENLENSYLTKRTENKKVNALEVKNLLS